MGLDIRAYSRLEFSRAIDDEEDPDYVYGRQTILYPNPDFVPQQDGLARGVYDIRGEQHGFRAGSYSGYNQWRGMLCRMALGVDPEDVWRDVAAHAGRPFVELIHFSDCEGFIGPRTSAKLLADFVEHRNKARSAWDSSLPYNYDLDRYDDWTRAFALAADGGAVCFG